MQITIQIISLGQTIFIVILTVFHLNRKGEKYCTIDFFQFNQTKKESYFFFLLNQVIPAYTSYMS